MTERKMTKEEVLKIVDDIWGPAPPKPKPKVVVNEAGIVRDADVQVSKSDPNWPGSDEGKVKVRRNDFVRINIELWEEQQAQKREDRRLRRMIDPCRMGHWGPIDDDE